MVAATSHVWIRFIISVFVGAMRCRAGPGVKTAQRLPWRRFDVTEQVMQSGVMVARTNVPCGWWCFVLPGEPPSVSIGPLAKGCHIAFALPVVPGLRYDV